MATSCDPDDLPPLLDGADNGDDDGGRMDDEIDDDDDDLDDWNLNADDDADDEEGESTTVLCLFCEESFPKMSEFHLHSKSKHEDFELKKFAKRLHLDSISFIKCVNYVRKNRVTPAELNRLRIDYSKVKTNLNRCQSVELFVRCIINYWW